MARSLGGRFKQNRAFAGAIIGFCFFVSFAFAQDAAKGADKDQPSGDPPVMSPAGPAADNQLPAGAPALSPQCDVPAADIGVPEPLPNVGEILRKGGQVRILAIGSSSTSGIGASSNMKTYPSQLEDILETALKGADVDIINRGVPGETAADTASRIRSEVITENPSLVLWQLGTNDALSRVNPDEFADTVRSTVDWLKDDHIDVVLVGMQYTARLAKDKAYYTIKDLLQKIADEKNILYVRRYDAMQFIAKTRANLQLMSSDNFHLNDLGYRCMAEHVARAVIASLYVKKFRPAIQ